MTSVPVLARHDMPHFERTLEMIQPDPNGMAAIQDETNPPEANHNETSGDL